MGNVAKDMALPGPSGPIPQPSSIIKTTGCMTIDSGGKNFHQPIIFSNSFPSGWCAEFHKISSYPNSQISNESIIGFTAAMRDNDIIFSFFPGIFYDIQSFGKCPDLIDLDQNAVTRVQFNRFF